MRELTENKGLVYEFGRFVLYPHERVLFVDGNPVHLADKVFDTLLVLIQNNGKLLTKGEMMASIWEESFVEEGNLAKNVSRLRKILNTGDTQMIETMPRRGYRFRADVREKVGDPEMIVHRHLQVRITQTITDSGESETFTSGTSTNENGGEASVRYQGRDIGGSTDGDRVVPRALETLPRTSRKTFPIRAGITLFAIAASALVYYLYISGDRVETGGTINLTRNVAEDNMPAWSPDGTKIAFISNRDGAEEIYVMSAKGGNVTRLTHTAAVEYTATWSPDGSKIIFDSDRDGNRELYAMNADGSNQTRLTFDPSSDAGLVSFSSDGEQFVFARSSSSERSTSYRYDIFVMNADGGGEKQLTRNPRFDAEPVWSPDGKSIQFISDRDNNFEIYSINLDGSGETNISQNPANDYFIAWTPDGKRLICMGDSEKPEFNQIYLMNPDGSGRRQVTSFTDKIVRVAYSPSAQKFAFVSRRDGNYEIYLTDTKALFNE